MTPGLIEHAQGNYKSEWDAPVTPADLPPVPDYEEIMIWDKKAPGRSGSDQSEDDITNPVDGLVGDFENPGFWDSVDGGFIGGDRTNADGEDGAENNGRQIGQRLLLIILTPRFPFRQIGAFRPSIRDD